MIRKALTLVLTTLSLSAFGHGSLIKGTVRDSLSGATLPGAAIILNDDQSMVSTDLMGNFKFDDLAAGTYRIRVSFIGYKTQTIEIVLAENAVAEIHVKLVPASLSLDEVTVIGTNTAEHMMTTISRIDVALRPVKSSQDILRMVPGLVTAQHAGGGKAEQIFLRGFDADHGTDIALTVDGIPVNMVSHAHGQGYADLHFLTPEIIEYVDFNKGPYFAKVGDFNTAGYANFHTKNSLDQSSVKLEGGRFDTYRTVAMLDLLNNPARNQHAYLAAEYNFTNGPFESPQHFNRMNVFGKFNGLVADDKILTVSLSTFSSKWDASGQIPQRAVANGLIDRFGAIDDSEGGTTGRTNFNLSLAKIFEDGSTFRNQVYFSAYDFELYSNFTYFLNDSVRGDQIRQKESRAIYGYNGTYQKEFFAGEKALHTTFGLAFRYDDIANNELSHVQARHTFINPVAFGDVDQINAGLYADVSFNIHPEFSINAGVRVDAFSFQHVDKLDSLYAREAETAHIISPKLNLYYNVSPGFQLYLRNGIGFHSNDTRVVVAQRARQILPRAYGTDLGAFLKPSKNLFVNVALWQLRLEQEFVYVGDEAVVEPSGETQRYGVDLSFRYQAATWLYADFDANYAHGRAVAEVEGEDYIPLAPTFTSIAGITVKARNGLGASLRYRWISDRPANEVNTVTAKGYFLLDAAVTYTRKDFEISLSGSNLLDREWNEAQFDTETRLPGEAMGMSDLAFTPGDPLFAKVGVTFFF